jgi:hypothetical protein
MEIPADNPWTIKRWNSDGSSATGGADCSEQRALGGNALMAPSFDEMCGIGAFPHTAVDSKVNEAKYKLVKGFDDLEDFAGVLEKADK